jgi:hypothetical protein
VEFFKEFSRALWSRKELADNEECPLVADQLQRAGDWAAIDFASSHSADYSLSRQSLSQLLLMFARDCRKRTSLKSIIALP